MTSSSTPLARTSSRPWLPLVVLLALAVSLHLRQLLAGKDEALSVVASDNNIAQQHSVDGWTSSAGGDGAVANGTEIDRSHSLIDSTDSTHESKVIISGAAPIATQSNNARRYIQVETSQESTTSWTESHSPYNQTLPNTNKNDIRISFRLHDPSDVPYPSKFLSVHGYTCHIGSPLPPAMSPRTIINFTTTISTNLNILFIGDSISQQFAQGFYASVLGDEYMGNHVIKRSFINGDDIRWTNSGLHVCSSLVAPTRGGGTSAYWRVLELMSNATEVRGYVNCKREKTWMAQEAKKLARHQYTFPTQKKKNELIKMVTSKNNPATTFYHSRVEYNDSQAVYNVGGHFDVCVLRPQHGWMELEEITRERIIEEIDLCYTVVGARTAIISTLPLNNNVLTREDWEGIIAINDVIRDIARSWEFPSAAGSESNGVEYVLVQEFGNFTNQILWNNAQHIGYNITRPDFTKNDGWERTGSDFLLHRYQGIKSMRHAPSIPMVCAFPIDPPFTTKNETAGDCFFNRVSRDGMHWCIEGLGSRYSANIACLLGCVYNGEGPQNGQDLRQCEQECNEQFMSLVPVDESWVSTNATMFSKSRI